MTDIYFFAEEGSWESLGMREDQTNQSYRKSTLNIHWKDWCWSWSSNTLATWCEELTHLKGPWCWERLKAGKEGDNRGWDGWMASLTQWTWVWVNYGSWWWTGESWCAAVHGVAKSQTQLSKWTELKTGTVISCYGHFAWVKWGGMCKAPDILINKTGKCRA